MSPITVYTTYATDHSLAVLLATLLPLVFLLIFAIIMGTLTRKLARHKGYTRYFWTGFFLGVIGLIYVVGLPDRSQAAQLPRTQLDYDPLNQ